MRKIWMANALALSLGVGMLGALPANASSAGRRNTTIGLGAAAAYQLLRGQTTTGLVLGAGAAYGYKRYKDAKRDEERDYRYSDRYRGYGSSDRFSTNDRSRSSDRYRPSDRYSTDDRYRSGDRYRPSRHDEYSPSSYRYDQAQYDGEKYAGGDGEGRQDCKD